MLYNVSASFKVTFLFDLDDKREQPAILEDLLLSMTDLTDQKIYYGKVVSGLSYIYQLREDSYTIQAWSQNEAIQKTRLVTDYFIYNVLQQLSKKPFSLEIEDFKVKAQKIETARTIRVRLFKPYPGSEERIGKIQKMMAEGESPFYLVKRLIDNIRCVDTPEGCYLSSLIFLELDQPDNFQMVKMLELELEMIAYKFSAWKYNESIRNFAKWLRTLDASVDSVQNHTLRL